MPSVQPVKGVPPPPTVTPVPSEGYLCPPGKEHDTLEWELVKWIARNKVPFVRGLTH